MNLEHDDKLCNLAQNKEQLKIIAFYLPQFHEIPENNEWWGKGFTEWTNVKKAIPLYKNHYQPRIPLNYKYYNLLDYEVKRWQVDLANEYGIYGFCIYHYWFDGHLLLEKPLEQFLADKSLHINFCISWANEDWTHAWAGKSDEVLITQNYGDKNEWERHMEFLLPYLQDERYIRTNGKPLFIIYRPEIIPCLNEMLDCMSAFAIAKGLPGVSFAFQHVHYDMMKNPDKSRFEYNIESQPSYALTADRAIEAHTNRSVWESMVLKLQKSPLANGVNLFRKSKFFSMAQKHKRVKILDYDDIWKRVINRKPLDSTCIPGAFVDWDNTPRKGNLGFVFGGASPNKFKEYMKKQIIRARTIYKKDMIFLFAWNEWAEGNYVEPDLVFGKAYLEVIKACVELEN